MSEPESETSSSHDSASADDFLVVDCFLAKEDEDLEGVGFMVSFVRVVSRAVVCTLLVGRRGGIRGRGVLYLLVMLPWLEILELEIGIAKW